MSAQLPNLNELEYKARQSILTDKRAMEAIKEFNASHRIDAQISQVELICQVFPQIWNSACTAFDTDVNGHKIAFQAAVTQAYTTVFYERISGIYVVFVGNNMCYKVTDANDKFKQDLQNRSLCSRSQAFNRY